MAYMAVKPQRITSANNQAIALRWESLERPLRNIAKKHLRKLSCDQLIIVARGGLVPSAIISHTIGVRGVSIFQAEKTRSNNPYDYRTLRVLQVPKIQKNKRYIIVEDIIYQGETTKRIFAEVKKKGGIVAAIVTIVLCKEAEVGELFDNTSLYSLYQCPENAWIRFPWEEPLKNEKDF